MTATNKTKKIILIIIAVIATLATASGVTYAVWTSSTTEREVEGFKVSQLASNTSKYLVVELFDTDDPHNESKMLYATYRDNMYTNNEYKSEGAFVINQNYAQEYDALVLEQNQSIDLSKYEGSIIGYTGNLGQFEIIELITDIKIVDKMLDNESFVDIKLLQNNQNTDLATIAITQVDMQSPEEFPALHLIKQVRIPYELEIKGVSFSYCDNLTKVIWLSDKTEEPKTFSPNAFRSAKGIEFVQLT